MMLLSSTSVELKKAQPPIAFDFSRSAQLNHRFIFVEAIRLRKADVGCRLRLTYTPVRSDLATGEPVSVLSEVVTQGEPGA